MSEQVFLAALLIVAGGVVMTARTIAAALMARGTSRAELAQLRDQLDQQAAALEDAQDNAASTATQLAELQERVDFTERLLAQSRERGALPPGNKNS